MAETHRGKAALAEREPKIIENRKKSLFIKGRKFPAAMQQVWDDLALFRFGEIVKFTRENDIVPFEDASQIQEHCRKNDCSLFTFATTNKKRPNDIIFGRLFNYALLDMYEFGVTNIIPHKDLPRNEFKHGELPALIFQGDQWNSELSSLRNYFMDYFVGDLQGTVDIEQVAHCIVFTYVEADKTILFRHYLVNTEKDTPELTLTSPCFDLVCRRDMKPDEEAYENALIKAPEEKKKKNVKKDALGRELGRVFVGKNDTTSLTMKKFPGLPKRSMRQAVQDAEHDLV
ncbi:Brix domain containing protein [Trichomonas vaginalis G3]|uniref:Ribosome production factor 2 homolog n=1 Tax=Trichomonas vaginalis (strain ATCC PRA-98 / G3) TaxID=412133 RepID=A2DBF4_TRIV3|nr:maturation of LSU-rRNA from tricistronic rRNA transcript (SSU-rRNA, 5.8S rRNA, LSU-rRNA) [Trichomonas vaginalis G3]EAY22157.1 Brix domain containing protein [Trichomonas vaginalis G3]KAI5533395.1 maturation of LSU-rRNA from tricistronic rRNA transcript (SSU-rRNA, 5.8S rRNA, LSU-rRNA) [Trichomonas vaginalis G3]|eukprot:XP_001583143.1 Brix domain containing protein [Trichomonas vaginalis G3]